MRVATGANVSDSPCVISKQWNSVSVISRWNLQSRKDADASQASDGGVAPLDSSVATRRARLFAAASIHLEPWERPGHVQGTPTLDEVTRWAKC